MRKKDCNFADYTQKNEDSLQMLSESLSTLHGCQQTAETIKAELARQRNTIDGSKRKLNETNDSLKASSNILSSMSNPASRLWHRLFDTPSVTQDQNAAAGLNRARP
ncbi:MAG: hypothetical protein ACHP65_10445 [Legionellales bacterium]